jgi:hypothetical protein
MRKRPGNGEQRPPPAGKDPRAGPLSDRRPGAAHAVSRRAGTGNQPGAGAGAPARAGRRLAPVSLILLGSLADRPGAIDLARHPKDP